MVRPAHRLPGALVGVHVPAPGQRLVGDPQAAGGGARGERVQLLGEQVDVRDGVGRHRGADQHRVGAERLHHLELVLGAAQVRGEALGIGRVQVAERLVEVDRQAQVRAAQPHLAGRQGRRDEVGLEDLDAVEPGRRRGRQLVLQRAGQAHGRDAMRGAASHATRPVPHRARSRLVALLDELGEVPQHPGRVRVDAGEQPRTPPRPGARPCGRRRGCGSRAPGPPAAARSRAGGRRSRRPTARRAAAPPAAAARGARPSRPAWRAPARPRPASSRASSAVVPRGPARPRTRAARSSASARALLPSTSSTVSASTPMSSRAWPRPRRPRPRRAARPGRAPRPAARREPVAEPGPVGVVADRATVRRTRRCSRRRSRPRPATARRGAR